MFQKKFHDLLEQPMSRREFLRNIGLMFVGMIGVNSAINTLSHGQFRHANTVIHKHITQVGSGFGGGKFGQ